MGCRSSWAAVLILSVSVVTAGVAQSFLTNYSFETASYREFSYGVSHRGASVRIPWQVAQDKKGYIEDRRPNANMDPYMVTRLIIETVCGTAEGHLPSPNGLTTSARTPATA